jgi:GTP1/Obg family GTP-binding protein
MKASDETHHPGESCLRCPSRHSQLRKLGFRIDESDYVIALAGNPNTGKTTVFNALTGLRMHTGNWPGKNHQPCRGWFFLRGETLQDGGSSRDLFAAFRLSG